MTYRSTALAAALLFCALLASIANATEARPSREPAAPIVSDRHSDRIYGGTHAHAKAGTVVVLGADGTLEGQFQDALGNPDWQGWTPVDNTAEENKWHVSDWQPVDLDPATPDNHVWWCGETFDNPCGQGVGHSYRFGLKWEGAVADPESAVDVKVVAKANIGIFDIGWDFLELQAWTAGGWTTIRILDGIQLDILIDEEFTLAPADLVGPASDRVLLRWWVFSDGAWDDEDCNAPGQVGAQLDLIRVYFAQQPGLEFALIGDVETCEPGDTLQWTPDLQSGAVGNFGHLWSGLDDLDPCSTNTSPQVAFIDDGLVVPGTGGYPCLTWCYGPGGYVVNPEGGLAGPTEHLDAMVTSPALTWPGDTYDGALLEFDVYRHLIHEAGNSGIYFRWFVRTASSTETLEDKEWVNEGWVHYGDVPDYYRFSLDISEYIQPQTTAAQVALGALESGWWWGIDGTDATPSPYFDNVRLAAFEIPGPRLYVQERDMAQDRFPPAGTVNWNDLASNSVRFDAAVNRATEPWTITPGDSVVFKVDAASPPIQGTPTMHYRLIPNPVFDAVRTVVPPGAGNTAFAGVVTCAEPNPPYNDGATWYADLPDAGFFFPGDVIHYYFRALDTDMRAGTVPADTTGFGQRPVGPAGLDDYYDPMFTVRALPSVLSATPGDQAKILLWDDSGEDEELDAWLTNLSSLPLVLGVDYDLFRTRDPWQGHSNGLGSFGGGSVMNYETILYSSGHQTGNTITSGEEFGDVGSDLHTLWNWLYGDGRMLLLMGDHLVGTMWDDPDPDMQPFIQNVMGVDYLRSSVRAEIDGQLDPAVGPRPGDPIFDADGWVVNGGCPDPDHFDHIVAVAPGYESAEFLDMAGAPEVYTAAAAVTAPFPHATTTSTIITIPYGMAAIQEIQQLPKNRKGFFPAGPLSFLYDLLDHAGHAISSTPPIPPALSLAAHPNPFNPQTTIDYTVDREGPVTIDLFDVRGRLVKRLVDEVRPAGAWSAEWDGRDDAGRGMSSGVYFCIMEAPSGRRALKVTLLR